MHVSCVGKQRWWPGPWAVVVATPAGSTLSKSVLPRQRARGGDGDADTVYSSEGSPSTRKYIQTQITLDVWLCVCVFASKIGLSWVVCGRCSGLAHSRNTLEIYVCV